MQGFLEVSTNNPVVTYRQLYDDYDRVGIEYSGSFRRLEEMVERSYKCKISIV